MAELMKKHQLEHQHKDYHKDHHVKEQPTHSVEKYREVSSAVDERTESSPIKHVAITVGSLSSCLWKYLQNRMKLYFYSIIWWLNLLGVYAML